mmetsp:Transcript_41805/g.94415  ORF Transcript_41805/g.94415 Transcript_41805/m.94415 type:complete len:211 (+) Transcript_41805:115-747(+)
MDQWVRNISMALSRNDGAVLADAFALLRSHDASWRSLPAFITGFQPSQLASLVGYQIEEKWGEAVMEYATCFSKLNARDFAAAYKSLSSAYLKLVTIFSQEDGWMLPLVEQSTFDLRVLAELADDGRGETCLRDASEKLQKAFSACINDRTDLIDRETGIPNVSRKRGVVFVAVSAFRVYFKIGNYRRWAFLKSQVVDSDPPPAPTLLLL